MGAVALPPSLDLLVKSTSHSIENYFDSDKTNEKATTTSDL